MQLHDSLSKFLSKFDVFSLNVRGIRDQIKRRSVFSFLKDQKAYIDFLQETYSEPNDEKLWKNGVTRYFSRMAQSIARVCVF